MADCDRPARIYPQLAGPPLTRGQDCGVSTTRTGVHFASCGRVRLDVETTRSRMGKPTGATNPPDWLRVFEHPDTIRDFAAKGLQAPEVKLVGVNRAGLFHGAPIKSAENALQNGRMILGAETYSVWHRHPEYRGVDPRFQDNHAVAYRKIRAQGDGTGRESNRVDPLRTTIVSVPWGLAKEAFAGLMLRHADGSRSPLGIGLWAGIIVKRADKIPGTPDPSPDPCADLLAAAEAAAEAWAEQLGIDQHAIDALTAAHQSGEAALAALQEVIAAAEDA